MNSEKTKMRYCFDTCALANSWRRHYRIKSFPGVWDHIGNLMDAHDIVVPEEVEKELGVGKDDLVAWFKRYRACVIPISQDQLKIVSVIVNKYPLVSRYKAPRPFHADPFLVALAKLDGRIVVTDEVKSGNSNHPAVPDLCKEYNVKCCNMAQFFELEGLIFRI